MAFTLSHMAVAPAIYYLSRRRIPLASIAVGCIIPDVIRLFQHNADIAHTYTGMVSIDLIFGLVCCLLWYKLYRPYIYFIFMRPSPPQCSRPIWKLLPWCALGVLLGTWTHLLWDAFTHVDFRTFAGKEVLSQVYHLPILTIDMPLHRILQYGTSLLALPFLYFICQPILQLPKTTINSTHYWAYFGVLLSIIAGGLTDIYYQAELIHYLQSDDIYMFLARGFAYFCYGAFVVFSVICILFKIISAYTHQQQ